MLLFEPVAGLCQLALKEALNYTISRQITICRTCRDVLAN